MPIYEYACGARDHRLEKLQKFSDVPLTDCSACGQLARVKLISAVGFQLNGTGWYATDFKPGCKQSSSDNRCSGQCPITALAE